MIDKGTHYIKDAPPRQVGGPRTRQRVRRFLCIGGPCAGAWRSREELIDAGLDRDYHRYNSAGGRGNHSQIFVHRDLLK